MTDDKPVFLRYNVSDVKNTLADSRRYTHKTFNLPEKRIGVFIGETAQGRCIVEICYPSLESVTVYREFGSVPAQEKQEAICIEAHETMITALTKMQAEIAEHLLWMEKGKSEITTRQAERERLEALRVKNLAPAPVEPVQVTQEVTPFALEAQPLDLYTFIFDNDKGIVKLKHSEHGEQTWQEFTVKKERTCCIKNTVIKPGKRAYQLLEGKGGKDKVMSLDGLQTVKNGGGGK